MKIIIAKNSGFCFGVRSAVETAEKNAGPHTYTYGDIIHNERVLEQLSQKGVKSVEDVSEITDSEATVIIRSHGAKKSVYDEIRNRGFRLIDATCPFVKKIHAIVREFHDKGYRIFIIGAASHPEVIGINGWCDDSATVIDENFDFADVDPEEKVCFVAQTTFSTEKYADIIKKNS